MKYRLTFQPMLEDGTPPRDHMDETIESDAGIELLPDIGDYVHIDRQSKHDGAPHIVGRVRRRLFFYSLLPSGDVCDVNITLEQDSDGARPVRSTR